MASFDRRTSGKMETRIPGPSSHDTKIAGQERQEAEDKLTSAYTTKKQKKKLKKRRRNLQDAIVSVSDKVDAEGSTERNVGKRLKIETQNNANDSTNISSSMSACMRALGSSPATFFEWIIHPVT